MSKTCKDCLAEWVASGPSAAGLPVKHQRPADYPGPRCYTHHNKEVKRVKAANHERMVKNTYGLDAGDYDRLYTSQLGTCAICKRATGATRKLSVDHDHLTGEVRGLLCRPCNDMLGHARDSDLFFYRAANYLQYPPAKGVLGHE